jgi:glycosyltransferase involved in cell wall biosynthesis
LTDNSNRNSKAIRVLHVVGGMVRGGAENWIMTLLRRADRKVLKMDICATSQQKEANDDEVIALGGRLAKCPLKPLATFSHRMRKVIAEGNYDVVHSHIWLFSGQVLRVAFQCNVPVRIAYSHTTQSKKPSLLRKIYSKYMRFLINKYATHKLGCSSEAMAALFGTDWSESENCRVLYCSVNIEAYRPCQGVHVSRADFGIPTDAIVIGHVGSFRPAKNHAFILDIAAELIRRNPKTYFFFAGDGNLRLGIEDKADRIGIKKNMVFAGDRNDVPQLMMNLFDLLLFPSVYEGMPLTLVEAAAAGLRVVCSVAITPEATDFFPEAFTRLSLDLNAAEWADVVEKTLQKGKNPQEHAYQVVKKSHFSDEYSFQQISAIYDVAHADG